MSTSKIIYGIENMITYFKKLKNKIIATRDKYIKEDFEGED